jgi:small-conductance mechanosensitive channel
MMLSALGVQITPILTALGVGGLAVALALQEPLANLFSGVHLLVDRPVRVGDYIKVSEGGVEGTVTDIGWRATRLQTLGNCVIVVPNKTMAQATLTNYSLPEPRLALGLSIRVDQAADAERVEAILADEVKRATGQVRGLLTEPAPGVAFSPGFGEYSLDFTIGYQVAEFVDQYQVQNELRKRILRRLRQEGIDIAVPARSIRVVRPPRDAARPDTGEPSGRLAASRRAAAGPRT